MPRTGGAPERAGESLQQERRSCQSAAPAGDGRGELVARRRLVPENPRAARRIVVGVAGRALIWTKLVSTVCLARHGLRGGRTRGGARHDRVDRASSGALVSSPRRSTVRKLWGAGVLTGACRESSLPHSRIKGPEQPGMRVRVVKKESGRQPLLPARFAHEVADYGALDYAFATLRSTF